MSIRTGRDRESSPDLPPPYTVGEIITRTNVLDALEVKPKPCKRHVAMDADVVVTRCFRCGAEIKG